jgi:hypothetical protein
MEGERNLLPEGKKKQVFEGWATFYEEKMIGTGTMDKSLFMYPTEGLANSAAEKAGRMKPYLIGGKAHRVRVEILE